MWLEGTSLSGADTAEESLKQLLRHAQVTLCTIPRSAEGTAAGLVHAKELR
jgi:hypothetical protein